jgi:site-specific recombinase XerD
MKACWHVDLLERRIGSGTNILDIDADAYREKRIKDGVKMNTVVRELRTLRAVLKCGERKGLIAEAPKVYVPLVRDARIMTMTEAEVQEVLGYTIVEKPEYWPMMAVAFDTGARFGEMAQLRWDCVDLEDGFIVVGKHCSYAFSKTVMRTLPLTNRLRRWLVAERARLGGEVSGDALLVKSPIYGGMLKKHDQDVMRDILAAVRPGFRVHDMRHSYAYRCAMNGVDIADLMFLMGHTNIKQTLVYRGFCKPRVAEMLREF